MELTEQYREILGELVECARALGDYRQDVVVTGGLVPLLYRFHPANDVPRQPPLLTNDLDFTVPSTVPLRGDLTLRTSLENGGFVVLPQRSVSADVPPKHLFQHSSRGHQRVASIYGEFLTPLTGSATTRSGRPKSPKEVQEGLNAEALRYLDLLLWKPLPFDLAAIGDIAGPSELEILLPRPGPYLAQKALASMKRNRPEKRDKDLAYIFDVAMICHRRWDEIADELQELKAHRPAWSKWLERCATILSDAFVSDSAFGPDAVSRVYSDHAVRSETVAKVMARFLDVIAFE